jgi:hypothetical protein
VLKTPLTISFNVSYDGHPRYRSISLSTVKENVATFAGGDPMTDWKALCEFISVNPGHYMTTSSFDQFVWDVPGYRFTFADDGKEVLVPIPEIMGQLHFEESNAHGGFSIT